MNLLLMCVDCAARHQAIVPADYVLDGRSLCQDCAGPMIKVIAGRMTTDAQQREQFQPGE